MIRTALDKIADQGEDDPLAALENVLRLIQEHNLELLAAMAPSVLASVRDSGPMPLPLPGMGRQPLSKREARELTSLSTLETAIAKTGAAIVKVRDERARREEARKGS
ncbi:MAG: hypothetical protein JXR37_06355 [Kiritimatiellae bacterium]|nr:hypothetical protein [Kiritimatiellia bacterium]